MMSGMKRPDPSKMVDDLFSKLDTTNKGYLEKSDLQSALSQLPSSGSTRSSANVDEMFKKLDGNGDGKLTKDEMSSGMKKLADALDSQLNQMRMNGTSQGGSGNSTTSSKNRPDPSKMVDDLFSKLDTTNKGYLEKSDLQSALSQSPGSGSSSGTGSSPNVDEIFKKLDSNGDGKLTKSEMTSGMSSTAQAGKGGARLHPAECLRPALVARSPRPEQVARAPRSQTVPQKHMIQQMPTRMGKSVSRRELPTRRQSRIRHRHQVTAPPHRQLLPAAMPR
jgi:Ca2+-binding EF-hand superfamily protein